MERVSFMLVGLVSFLCATQVAAGTVFYTPPAQDAGDGYPTSRFGAPPPKVDTGVDDTYASRAVSALEAGDSDSINTTDSGAEGGRSPASLQFGKYTGPAPIAPAEMQNAAQGQAMSTEQSGPSGQDAALTMRSRPPVYAPEPTRGEITRRGVQEVALIAGDLGFFPKVVFVSPQVPVRLFVTGASKNTLCIMMDSFQVRKQVRSQKVEEITFTPNLPGKYRFYCPVNGSEGTMVVRDQLASASGE